MIPEPPPGTVVWFSVVMGHHPKLYTFAALGVTGGLWYVTGTQARRPFTWPELVYDVTRLGGQLFIATSWTPLGGVAA